MTLVTSSVVTTVVGEPPSPPPRVITFVTKEVTADVVLEKDEKL